MGTISREQWEELAIRAKFEARILADLCGLSIRQLQRQFRRSFGQAPQQWLNERRMLAAQQQLLAGEPVKKVALDLGFKHVSHFCMQFKSLNKMTPTKFVSVHLQAENVAQI